MKYKKEAIILAILFVLANANLVLAERVSSEETTTDFIVGGNSPICIASSGTSSWSIGGISTDAMNDCYNENGVDSNGNEKTSCCPSGYTCNTNTDKCEANAVPQPTVTSCADYSMTDCGNFLLTEEIKNSIEEQADVNIDGELIRFCDEDYINDNPNVCLYLAECKCAWINDACKETYLIGDPCINEPGFQEPIQCSTVTNQIENKCNEPGGALLMSWTGRLVYPASGNPVPATDPRYANAITRCKTDSKEFPCPVKSTLPFFTALSFVISLGIVFVIYFVFRKRINLI